MGVPDDLKLAYIEVGVRYNVLNKVSGEYCMYEMNSQVTKPFIREHFLEAFLPFDTQAETGDVLVFPVLSGEYLVMNKTPDVLENEVIEYDATLYKVNCTGEIRRPVETRNSMYQTVTEWQVVQDSCKSLITEAFFGYGLDNEKEVGLLGLVKDEFYIPASYGVQVMDRVVPRSGEFRMIASIMRHRFPSIDVCYLEEDTRE